MRRIEYPQLMNPHQRQQGYIPSSSSMFASQPSQLMTPPALLFQPNGVQPPPPPPPPPSMLYAHTLPTRSSISSLADNYNAMSAYPVAPPPPPPAPPAQFIGFPDARSSSMPDYHPHPRLNNPYNMPPRPPKERISPPRSSQPLMPKPSSSIDATSAFGLRAVTLPSSTLPRFLSIAALNTAQNRETCGLLLGKLRKNTFYVSTLLIPKQTATDDTCTMTDEELVFEFQDKRELLTLGWVSFFVVYPPWNQLTPNMQIHTHPSQSCQC